MLTSSRELLSFRTLAILPIILFLPVVVSFAVDPGAIWPEYIGVFFHLSVLVLAVRLGGHVLAGLWMATASVLAADRPIRIVGTIAGAWLAGYSFVGNLFPTTVLAPASLLTLTWFALLAFRYERG